MCNCTLNALHTALRNCNGFESNNNICGDTKYNKYSRLIWLFVTFEQRLISTIQSIGIGIDWMIRMKGEIV